MISLIGLSKSYTSREATKVVFDRVDLELPVDRKLALLGPRGSGKTTLFRLLAGLERPSAGRIERRARVSLPVGYSRGFMPTLSARQNTEFFARCYGADVDEVVKFVQQISEIENRFDQPMRELVGGLRTQFAFTLSYALPCDFYLVDGVPAVGNPRFKERCLAMFAERAKHAGILFAAPNPAVVRRYCDQALLIARGKITLYADLDEAFALLKELDRDHGLAGVDNHGLDEADDGPGSQADE